MEALQRHGVNIGLLFLRVTVSLSMILAHGLPKLQNFSTIAPKFPDPVGFLGGSVSLGLAIFGEVVCPAMIILGIKTRFAAIPAAMTMVVAAFLVHGADPYKAKELAFMYLFVFIALIFTGGGKLSVRD
ncbi:DoxX family protein [Halobacteriovorax sp. GB3]|uniref:DoxX family protein n=1 Tax=Halobacteriovorax sp. GB3 TaxID=2719615 RepID=UPI002360D12A|nr:DoxX family protein [Halobacteriovorax sp. GB3]MDD0852890.1 DoxX family protein [Halobacteriovorax sp. GB3]